MTNREDVPGCSSSGDSHACPECRHLLERIVAVCPHCGHEITQAENSFDTETRQLSEDRNQEPTEVIADPLIGGILDVYRIHSLLGEGGMGRVYFAHHVDLKRPCALKVLSPERSFKDIDFVSRFRNEGRAAASLVHPNIVTVHALGESDGFHYLEMEFVAGRSLYQLLRSEGHLNPTKATAISARIAEGLAAAHCGGIIHRDLKPDNVLMTHQGIPKLADFGLARRVALEGGAEGLLGTPSFMAPELFHGAEATPAIDVYSLGVTYFFLLTGRYPFEGKNLSDLIHKIQTQPVPNVRDYRPDVPLEMTECVNVLMSRSPKERPLDGIEAAQLLLAIQGQIRDLDSLLQEAFFGDSNITLTREGDRHRAEIQLPDGRRQRIVIESSEHSVAERLLTISSICCEADPAYYEYALRLNAEIPHGGISVRAIDGKPQFVMMDTYPRSTVDAEEIRRSVLEVAYRSDAVEKLLTGHDRN